MNKVEFSLDKEDSTGIFFYAGIRKGQIIGLMAPHIIVKYLKLTPVYSTNRHTPDYLKDKNDKEYGFVYSKTDIFDLASSYEIGFGRARGNMLKTRDKYVFLQYLGGTEFVAHIYDNNHITKNLKNGKFKVTG